MEVSQENFKLQEAAGSHEIDAPGEILPLVEQPLMTKGTEMQHYQEEKEEEESFPSFIPAPKIRAQGTKKKWFPKPPPSSEQTGKLRIITKEDLASKALAQSLLKHNFWTPFGVGQHLGCSNRVILLVGRRQTDNETWKSIAAAVSQAAVHADAFVLDEACKDAAFSGFKIASKTVFNAMGISPSRDATKLLCKHHRASVCLTDDTEFSDEEFIEAKLELAQNLAGGNRIVVINCARELDQETRCIITKVTARQWPIVAISDAERPNLEKLKWTCFPKNPVEHEAELASVIHLHLTITLQ